MGKKLKGINGSEIKYIAILAMLIDHIAWQFVPTLSLAGQLMHFIGRITAPIMCFFIAEGFHYTRNVKKYLLRLGIFAVISHFAFSFYMVGRPIGCGTSSMISTLFLSLLTLCVLNSDKFQPCVKAALIAAIMFFVQNCDYGTTAIWMTLVFSLSRENRKMQYISYAVVIFVTQIIPILHVVANNLLAGSDLSTVSFFRFGMFLPIPLLMLYNGERGGSKATKWVFYIFYPAHLIFIECLTKFYG